MTRRFTLPALACFSLLPGITAAQQLQYFAGDGIPDTLLTLAPNAAGETVFHINGAPTYSGLGLPVSSEGLLHNIRWVQASIDDADGVTNWSNIGPTTGWDPEENTDTFIDALAEWKSYGVRAFTINFQGGCQCTAIPEVSGGNQTGTLINSPFGTNGVKGFDDWDNDVDSPESQILRRAGSFIRAADDMGMVVILGVFYFGQDDLFGGTAADDLPIRAAVDRTIQWIIENDFTNVIVEIANEADISINGNQFYKYDILNEPSNPALARVSDLLQRVRLIRDPNGTDPSPGYTNNPGSVIETQLGGQILTTVSGRGRVNGVGFIPYDSWIENSDVVLLHGNGYNPSNLGQLVDDTRARIAALSTPVGNSFEKPVVFNEDPGGSHTSSGIQNKTQHLQIAHDKKASWGLYWDSYHQSNPFDPRIHLHAPMQTMANKYAEVLGITFLGTNFCGPAVPNSQGEPAQIRALGSVSVTSNSLRLQALRLPINSSGYFIAGQTTNTTTMAGGQGTLCINATSRFSASGQVGFSGRYRTFALDVDLNTFPTATGPIAIVAGQTWHFQTWFRDANPQVTSNFTDAVTVLFTN